MNLYSVARIEQAKQQALKGMRWHKPECSKRLRDNWSDEDEHELVAIFKKFDIRTNGVPTHEALSNAIDNHDFPTSGRHSVNAKLHLILQMALDDGRVKVADNRKQTWMTEGVNW